MNDYSKGDVYFISHGGPVTGDQKHSEPYQAWQKIGKIIQENPPKGIIIVSAHWESDSKEGVIVNSNSNNPLIYDFYNFPKRFYDQKFESHFSSEIENSVLETLKFDGISYDREDRGFDHGVWIALRAIFGQSTSIPMIQISLPDTSTSDPVPTTKLGKSLSNLRNKGYTIMGSGQGVHNTRDLVQGQPMPYTQPFLKLLNKSLTSSDPLKSTMNILKSPLYKKAHPSNEHFYPIFVSLGAIQPDDIKEDIYVGVVDLKGNNVEEKGLGWTMYRWKKG